MHHFSPQTGAFQYVCLVDGDDILVPLLSGFKGNLCNPFDFHTAIAFGIIGFFAILAGSSAPFAKVDTASQFPNHHDIKALGNNIFPQRAVTLQSRIEFRRTQVGKQSQSLPNAEQSLFRTQMWRHGIPLGMTNCTANRTEEHAVACQTAVYGFLWQRNASCINCTAANQIRGASKGMVKLFTDFLQNSNGTIDDFRANAIALE